MEEITKYLTRSTVHTDVVKAWRETVKLPTYEIGKEEKNPIFLEKRVYQGSSGVVYPYPVIEKISDEKTEKEYNAVFIENLYLKIMILPELGGRVQMAYDKIRERHFVYYNQVVKPALVGLTGPWISGGIEFNWPQHHRPSTFLPTDCKIEEFADGSKTVWCSEVERMFHTKGMAGFTLYPGKCYLEIKAKVYNRTPLPQTFLWWANPAVSVNKHYYSVFPPDVNAVFDHGKRDVSTFPIATGIYYKQDYSFGVDISRYENIPVPTSYMAINSKYDFVGGYEENIGAGLLHVADHHVNAGKKQWTWGHGDFGQAWDRNLTDEDGPYIELMTGMYCDNQPDFTWLQPYEEKSWTQYFMPYTAVGHVKNATKDAVINICETDGKGMVSVYVTSVRNNLRILVADSEKTYLDIYKGASPAVPIITSFDLHNRSVEGLRLTVSDGNDGTVLATYEPEHARIKPIPDPAKAAKSPKDIASIEQLYLTGLHLEQYRHATYHAEDYYLEALRREPKDMRCNNAMGLMMMRRGQFAKARPYFEQAVKTLIERNPNPIDGEAYYNLGWCLKLQGKTDEAFDAFYKSTWCDAQQASGYMGLAQIATMRGDYQSALDFVDRSLIKNSHNHKARQLKSSILRKMGNLKAARQVIDESLAIDKFNIGCRFEAYLLGDDDAPQCRAELKSIMRAAVNSYIDYSFDFANAGLYDEATELLNLYVEDAGEDVYPIIYYAIGYFYSKKDDEKAADAYYALARQMKPDCCFPNRLEEVVILRDALRIYPQDTKALYYLGNFWYNSRQYDDAISCWEQSAAIDATFPTVLRNLALAYYNKRGRKDEARELLEKAFALDPTDARVLMELDQLYKKLHYSHRHRLDFLESHLSLVEQRDDLCIERITLCNLLGEHEKAKELLTQRHFHPWEGGEGKVTGQFVICQLALALKAISDKRYRDAVDLLKETEHYPHNLGEGKLAGAEENDINYYMGCAYEALGETGEAQNCFKKATVGSKEPAIAFFYNDQQPDKIYYQGLAWRKLGDEKNARSRFNKLIASGEKHLFDKVKIDYFAVSLPDLLIWEEDLNVRNEIYCNLVMGLGNLGLGNTEKAKVFLSKVKELDNNYQGLYFDN